MSSFKPWTAVSLMFVVGLVPLVTTACARAATAEIELEQGPYRLVEPDVLEVRADVLERLRFRTVERAKVRPRAEGFGALEFAADASYAVRVPVSAFVERVHVVVGERVEPGDPLLTVRSSEIARLRAEVRRLQAEAASERDAVERFERLVEGGAASKRELVEAQARLNALSAEIAGLREILSAVQAGMTGHNRLTIRASAAGQILARNVEPGERIGPDDDEAAVVIGDGEQLVVRASFPERYAPSLSRGASCWYSIPALGSKRFEGTLTQVSLAVDDETRTASAFCRSEDPSTELRARMVARVEVELGDDATLLIPRDVVLLRRDRFVAFVRVGEGRLERRELELGARIGPDIQVLSGLSAGESVVDQGAVLLDGELDRLL
ncbi:putative Co/Zn/Cd efflux system membrane fusion protein [Enhygromyxa salina]|uniref:Putative Co/Zn/Cd efflux system membrane fusion protein n=1 Tax=Enhygromyxa salina TaxID=215803 RepID=A0A0C1ZR90_9BACT|nr:efflux RND transporter periplasmic adaptor subunit [Enhygromyxa salina]KIG13528.1 putative Co/Zn/Cd efflux system membrane fusion protein [Enhygromyxa salina]